jgi:lactate dehydrogenase-like 2-hydroxyacid dehydrogenase
MSSDEKPIVLHLGDPNNPRTPLSESIQSLFQIISPPASDLARTPFLVALGTKQWGDFSAIVRVYSASGSEMGPWDDELISLLPRSCKVLAFAGDVDDSVIDLERLAHRGIVCCDGSLAAADAISDMALYHIISVFRNIQWSNMAARSGDEAAWVEAHHNVPLTARNPAGMVLGIVGAGSVGYRTAEKAYKALGMQILYHDPVASMSKEQQDAAGGAVRCQTLGELLRLSDCVVLASSFASAGRRQIIDADALAQMKKGSRLVNVAHGSLVSEEAVADALDSRHLFAVGLDAFESELRPNTRLLNNRFATLTCSTGAGTLETAVASEELAMQNVVAVLAGQPAMTPVNQHFMKV